MYHKIPSDHFFISYVKIWVPNVLHQLLCPHLIWHDLFPWTHLAPIIHNLENKFYYTNYMISSNILSNTKPHISHIFDILISCFGFEKNNNIVYITLSCLCCSICEFINTILFWLRFICLLTFIVFVYSVSNSMSTHFPLVDFVGLRCPRPLSMASFGSCNTQHCH